jgi:signal transduction histidine kinase
LLLLFFNDVFNALKYTAEEGVVINWEKKSDEEWLLSVRDTGPGLGSTNAASLSPEANNEQEIEGSGESGGGPHGEDIGLLIVRQLCKLLDALTDLETSPDEGTEFNIVFPLEYS